MFAPVCTCSQSKMSPHGSLRKLISGTIRSSPTSASACRAAMAADAVADRDAGAVERTTIQATPATAAISSVNRMYRRMDRLFFFQAEDGIRDKLVTGVQTCALPILDGDDGGVLQARRDERLAHEADLGV